MTYSSCVFELQKFLSGENGTDYIQVLPLYKVEANSVKDGSYSVFAENLSTIETAPPKNFGGPGNIWSPEDMFVATVADCFLMTFAISSSPMESGNSATPTPVSYQLARLDLTLKRRTCYAYQPHIWSR